MKKIITTTLLAALCLLAPMLMILLPTNVTSVSNQNRAPSIQPQQPRGSSIGGSDLYSEQISVYLAGQNCLIRQSALTTDQYILNQVPLDDIAFKNASMLVFMSNGIYPSNYSDVYTPFNELVNFQIPMSGIFVYIAYNKSAIVTQNVINTRIAMALPMLENAFKVELFQENTGNASTFMYYGVTPIWDVTMNELASQLPVDGYFKYLNVSRLTSSSYLSSHHLSAGFASINPYGGNLLGVNATAGLSSLLTQFSVNASLISGLLGMNFGGTKPQILTHRTNMIFFQYEALSSAIQYVSSQQTYTFDLRKALGLADSDILRPSGNVWNSLLNLDPTGILATMINVNVISGNVTSWSFNAHNLTIDSQILNTLYLASSFVSSQKFDINTVLKDMQFAIDNVFFITNWEKTGALSTLYSNVNMTKSGYEQLAQLSGVNPSMIAAVLNQITLDESPLALAGFNGLPYVPTGLLVPLPDLIVNYQVKKFAPQPILVVKQDTSGSIKPFRQIVDLRMNVTNVGSTTAWGMKIGHGTESISNLTNGILNWGTIGFDVRGFFVPVLSSGGILGVYYGAQNILLKVNTYQGAGTQGVIIRAALQAALTAETNQDVKNAGYVDLHELIPSTPLNYIGPGGNLKIDLSNSTITGAYSPFANENASFTNATILQGVQPPPSTNNDTNALTINGRTWNIASTNTAGKQNITVAFTFNNNTSNVNKTRIAALGFTYQGYNNVSIYKGGMATFFIYNYNKSTWIPVSNLTRSTVSINNTNTLLGSVTFRIYDGNNDTNNKKIKLADYMSGKNNTVNVQIRILNNASTLLQVDYFGMDYLQRNNTLTLIPQVVFSYTDLPGYTIRQGSSDSLYVGSRTASALVVLQDVTAATFNNSIYITKTADARTMTIQVFNKGNGTAKNVNVSIAVPGIIASPGDFHLHGNYLNWSIASLTVNASVKLSFGFIIPNSETIPGATVQYNNSTKMTNSSIADFTIRANTLYVDAPVDYKTSSTTPYILATSVSMNLVNPASIPGLNQPFNVSYAATLSHLPSFAHNITIPIAGTPYFIVSGKASVLVPLSSGSGVAQKMFNKTSYQGYLVPPFSLANNNMSGLMRYVPPDPLQVGQINITIQKSMGHRAGTGTTILSTLLPAEFHVTRDDYIDVVITITNTGTLPVGFIEKMSPRSRVGFSITDDFGYNQSGFEFVSGNIAQANITLNPGNATSFGYRLQAYRVGQYMMGSTQKTFYFLREQTIASNIFTIIVDEKPTLIAAYLGTSIGVTVIIVLGSIYNRKKQARALEEFKKRDKILYDKMEKSRETYQEYLD
ncbi:MAG TPA: hypothetical protein VKM55_21785 [Candidatus Lokiarchaeia archaeon]|nr:hypothetical protein [Candidatus Lokiarchaeia archaeon]